MARVLGSATPRKFSVPQAGTPGRFPSILGTYTATGVSIPPLSLDRWFRARNNSANQLVEVVVKGDSTMAGQVQPVDDAAHHYSPLTRIRALLNSAGYTDGGHGLNNGANDTPSVSGDAVSGVSSVTGFGNSDSFQLPSETSLSGTVNDTVTFSGYGTHVRIFYRTSTAAGTFTYSVDGGSAVTINAGVNPNGYAYNFNFVNVAGLANGLHTVTIVNTGSGSCNVICDFVRTSGIVLHNHSVRGAATSAGTTSAQALELELGLQQSPTATDSTAATDASTRPLDTRTGVRRPVLYISALGINNQQGSGTTDASATLNAHTILYGNAARAAGADFLIVIPAFESASQSQLAPNYRQALKDAATTLAAPWVDIGMGGAIPTLTAGSTSNNPHLTQAQYQTQGDFIWNNVLGAL